MLHGHTNWLSAPTFFAMLLFPPFRVRRRSVVALGLLLALAGCAASGCAGTGERPPPNFSPPAARSPDALPPPDPADRAAIRSLLRRQEAAWNEGDLEGFMRGYARSDTLRFASGGSVRTGWQQALDGYRERYPSRQAMGTLTFSDLDVTLLSGRHALAFGRWQIDRADGAPSGGLFTLLLQKTATGDGRAWRIVADHTSSD